MTSKLVALGGAALALLMVSSLLDPADARRGGGGGDGARASSGGGGGRAFTGGGGGRAFTGGRQFTGRSFNPGVGGQAFRYNRGGHRHAHRFHAHRFHGRRLLFAAPLGIYGYEAYSDGCYWLRQRALYTGSAYWWDRYNACISGYNDYY